MGVLMGLLGGYRALKGKNVAFRADEFPKMPSVEVGLSEKTGFLKGHLRKFGVKREPIRRMSVLMGVSGKRRLKTLASENRDQILWTDCRMGILDRK